MSKTSTAIEIESKKGPVIAAAIIAGTMAAKQTSNLIPFCHQVALDGCDIDVSINCIEKRSLNIDCRVYTTNKTGVEMEALVGCTTAALCIYDMLKALSHDIVISKVHLISKSGGKSDYVCTQTE